MSPALPLVKLGIGIAAGVPVSKILGDVIKNNVTVVTQSDALKVKAGQFIIASMIAGSLTKTTDKLVDNAIDVFTTVKNRKNSEDSTEGEVVTDTTP